MKLGVLALQGDVPEHRTSLERVAGPGSVTLVHRPAELAEVEALSMPGGESTTISRLLDETRLRDPLRSRIEEGLPVLATCAGLILLSREIETVAGPRDPVPIPVLDVTVRRNDYGRQRDSFEGPVEVNGLTGAKFPGVFIRAPRILRVGPGAEAFAWQGKEVVGVRRGRVWGLTFHPELSGDLRLFDHFLESTLG